MTPEKEEKLGRAMYKLAQQERAARKELRSMMSFHEHSKSKRNGSKGGRRKIDKNASKEKEVRKGTEK